MAHKLYTTIGVKYLGNCAPAHMEVHDLHGGTANCQIEEILRAGHAVGFTPETLEQAHREGYDNCAWCIGGSTR